jgi:hypothetical protein
MRLRTVLVPLVVSAIGVVAVQAAASAHDGRQGQHGSQRHDWGRNDSSPLTEQNFTITSDFNRDSGGAVVASGAIKPLVRMSSSARPRTTSPSRVGLPRVSWSRVTGV